MNPKTGKDGALPKVLQELKAGIVTLRETSATQEWEAYLSYKIEALSRNKTRTNDRTPYI